MYAPRGGGGGGGARRGYTESIRKHTRGGGWRQGIRKL